MRFRQSKLFALTLLAIVLFLYYELVHNNGRATRPIYEDDYEYHKAKKVKDDAEKNSQELNELLKEIHSRRAELALLEKNVTFLRREQISIDQRLSKLKGLEEKRRQSLLRVENAILEAEEKQDEAEHPDTIKKLEDQSFDLHGFNEYRSEQFPLNRSIPDVRTAECIEKRWEVTAAYPSTSIIICFVNEAWSTLLRSVWSVLNRSPPSLIHEVILVDDYSDAAWLGKRLIDYVENVFPKKVKLIRAPKRLGLIRARLLGAGKATGTVLTFLDSHIEANVDWLPPLLEPISRDRTAVVTPIIDAIDDHTLLYSPDIADPPSVGTFSWNLEFGWMRGRYGETKTDPMISPTMAGGLFSIDRKYFYEIGSYDEAMDGWGGENIEMSFRIWQCGGKIFTAPCSHVGHIFRSKQPYKIPEEENSKFDTFTRNTVRLVEVWMDEFKEFYYKISPHAKEVDFGDVSQRKKFRSSMKCKSFQWYMENVMPEGYFIPDSKHMLHFGSLKNIGTGECLDKIGNRNSGDAGTYPCPLSGDGEIWMYTNKGQVRTGDDACLMVEGSELPKQVELGDCENGEESTYFSYEGSTHLLRHTATGSCVSVEGGKLLAVHDCSSSSRTNQWTWVEK